MTTVAETHYDILGVLPTADPDVIKGAYRALIRKFHPDVAGAAGAEMTGKVNHAFDVLSDPQLRREYDREHRETAEEPQYQPPAPHDDGRAPAEPTTADWTDEPVYEQPAAPQLIWSPRRLRFAAVATLVSAAVLVAGGWHLLARFGDVFIGSWAVTLPLLVGLAAVVAVKRRVRWQLIVPFAFPTFGPFLALAGWWGFVDAAEAFGPLTVVALALLGPAALAVRFTAPWWWRLWRARLAKK